MEDSSIENVKAEQAVLGTLMLGGLEGFQKINFLKPEHFFEPVHKRIFETISTMFQNGTNPTPVTMKNHFDSDAALADIGGAGYLSKLAGLSSMINLKSHAQAIVESYTRRRLSQLGYWLQDAARDYTDGKNAPEILGSANRILEEINSQTQTHEILSSRQVGLNIVESFKNPLMCYKTGILKLDEAMGGGLYEGKAYGIAARKKVGKTIMASTISYNLNESGIKHLFIAAEMSPTEIQQRNIARGINRNSIMFLTQQREEFEFQSRVADFSVNRDAGNILYLHIPGITFDELKRNIAMSVYKHGIKGFIFDYFQLVRGINPRQGKVEFFDEVAQWIADFCRQEKLWSITTAQINQEDNIRWGEGMRLAFDQVYHLQKSEQQESMYFMEMMDTRYTPWMEIGTATAPIIQMQKSGPFFREVDDYVDAARYSHQ